MNLSPGVGTGILWRRLDAPGHDAARLVEAAGDVELRGVAVFRDEGGPTAIHYMVRCNAGWETKKAHIQGWRGDQSVDFLFARDGVGRWSLNGVACPAVTGCIDLDLSFTPATNLLPLRRLDLAVGGMAEVRSAWLEWPAGALTGLVQRYARESSTAYRYEADLPGSDTFVGVLRVDRHGWVLDYAGLWQAEPAT